MNLQGSGHRRRANKPSKPVSVREGYKDTDVSPATRPSVLRLDRCRSVNLSCMEIKRMFLFGSNGFVGLRPFLLLARRSVWALGLLKGVRRIDAAT